MTSLSAYQLKNLTWPNTGVLAGRIHRIGGKLRRGKQMSEKRDSIDVHYERISIQSGWTEDERETRRLRADDKQWQLRQLLFYLALSSQTLAQLDRNTLQLA